VSVICDYCGQPATLLKGAKMYPHLSGVAAKNYYRCDPCKAHVGCHPGTVTPLGRLANKALRQAKMRAHDAFDPLWRAGGMSRHEAYRWLSATLGISGADCHIGMFDEAMCLRVEQAVAGLGRKDAA
jgi:hypothetical protein